MSSLSRSMVDVYGCADSRLGCIRIECLARSALGEEDKAFVWVTTMPYAQAAHV